MIFHAIRKDREMGNLTLTLHYLGDNEVDEILSALPTYKVKKNNKSNKKHEEYRDIATKQFRFELYFGQPTVIKIYINDSLSNNTANCTVRNLLYSHFKMFRFFPDVHLTMC